MEKNKTKKADTFDALDSHFFDGKKACVNWERINDCLIETIDNVEPVYNYAIVQRHKPYAVAWLAFMYLAKDLLVSGFYLPSNTVTSSQLKAYMAREKVTYDVFQPAIEYVMAMRKELAQ